MFTTKFKVSKAVSHVEVQLFTGLEGKPLMSNGSLIFTIDEWSVFKECLTSTDNNKIIFEEVR